jgi:hypothetical protein
MFDNANARAHLRTLSQLVFCPERLAETVRRVMHLDQAERDEFLRLSDLHHVLTRVREALKRLDVAAIQWELTPFGPRTGARPHFQGLDGPVKGVLGTRRGWLRGLQIAGPLA